MHDIKKHKEAFKKYFENVAPKLMYKKISKEI